MDWLNIKIFNLSVTRIYLFMRERERGRDKNRAYRPSSIVSSHITVHSLCFIWNHDIIHTIPQSGVWIIFQNVSTVGTISHVVKDILSKLFFLQLYNKVSTLVATEIIFGLKSRCSVWIVVIWSLIFSKFVDKLVTRYSIFWLNSRCSLCIVVKHSLFFVSILLIFTSMMFATLSIFFITILSIFWLNCWNSVLMKYNAKSADLCRSPMSSNNTCPYIDASKKVQIKILNNLPIADLSIRSASIFSSRKTPHSCNINVWI